MGLTEHAIMPAVPSCMSEQAKCSDLHLCPVVARGVRRSPQQSSSKQPSARDAIMLDMGLYETPLSMLPSTATESGTLNLQAIFAKSTTRLVSTTASIQPVLKDSYIVTLPAQMQLIKQQQQQQQPGSWARSLSVLSSVSGYASRAQRSMTGDVSTSSEAGAGCGQVRLYQLLAPELAGRAVVFGSKLALCDDWRCIDPPYFAAPGARMPGAC